LLYGDELQIYLEIGQLADDAWVNRWANEYTAPLH